MKGNFAKKFTVLRWLKKQFRISKFRNFANFATKKIIQASSLEISSAS